MGTNYQTYLEEAYRVLKLGYFFFSFYNELISFNLACFPRYLTYCSFEQWLALDSRSEEQV
jgi:hypothetical protein